MGDTLETQMMTYFDEYFKAWFIFGRNPRKMLVDLSDGTKEIAKDITVTEAAQLIYQREETLELLVGVISKLEDPYAVYTELRRRLNGLAH